MRPQEFRERLARRPLAYLPLGTLEWHGEQLPLGSDAPSSAPELVDLGAVDSDREVWPQGGGGEDPRDAAAGHGRDCIEESVGLVGRMLEKAGMQRPSA